MDLMHAYYGPIQSGGNLRPCMVCVAVRIGAERPDAGRDHVVHEGLEAAADKGRARRLLRPSKAVVRLRQSRV